MDLGTFIGEVPNGAVVELKLGHELRGAEHVGPFLSEGEVAAGMVEAASRTFELEALAADGQRPALDGQRDGMRNTVADSGVAVRILHEHTTVVASDSGSDRDSRCAPYGELRGRAAYECDRDQKKRERGSQPDHFLLRKISSSVCLA